MDRQPAPSVLYAELPLATHAEQVQQPSYRSLHRYRPWPTRTYQALPEILRMTRNTHTVTMMIHLVLARCDRAHHLMMRQMTVR